MTADDLDVYLVGGAVRDELLGLVVTERDWVVVGATPEQMLSLNFKQVGKDFPVFLHPQTNEEYALARTERKAGHGYSGFEVHASAEVSLEQDLLRRDLTINAIARDSAGNLIDPCGGRADLNNTRLRHVSDAFTEDPLRVLRTARFAARLHSKGFRIAPETLSLMRATAASGELNYLPGERLWVEMEKALATDSPWIFIEVLQQCGALDELFPNWQPSQKALDDLRACAKSTQSRCARYTCVLSDQSPRQVAAISEKLKAPRQYRELAGLAASHCKSFHCNTGGTALALYTVTDAWRRSQRFEDLLVVAAVVAGISPEQCTRLQQGLQLSARIDTSAWQAEGIKGSDMGNRVQAERLRILNDIYSD